MTEVSHARVERFAQHQREDAMLVKIIGILLIVVGGAIALETLFPLIGSVFGLIFLLIKLALALGCVAVGYRLLVREA